MCGWKAIILPSHFLTLGRYQYQERLQLLPRFSTWSQFTTSDKAHVRTHASAKIDFVNPAPQILGLIQYLPSGCIDRIFKLISMLSHLWSLKGFNMHNPQWNWGNKRSGYQRWRRWTSIKETWDIDLKLSFPKVLHRFKKGIRMMWGYWCY